MTASHSSIRLLNSQHGYTLLEIMIAMVIGLVMLGGLLTIEQGNRTVFGDQNKLAQLQDSERMAMTMITDVIQAAGYFPDPTAESATNALTANGSFAAGQAITGTYTAAAPGDTITVRYVTANLDGVINCSGSTNATGGNQPYVNAFSVVGGQLICTMNGTQYNLVSNVNKLAIWYGVNTAGTGNTVDTYMTAAQVTASNNWSNVVSAMVQLTFTNPLWVAGQTAQPATLSIQRVVGVMNKAGPTT